MTLNVGRIALLVIIGSIATLPASRAQDGALPGSNGDFEQRMQRIVDGLRAATAGAPPMTLADRMNALHVPGVSIAVVHGGIVEARGFGVAAIGGPPVLPETLFQAASISKPVTAVAALALAQAGELDLDGDVNLSLKSWKIPANSFTDRSKVTLRRLLNHSAGITVPYFPGYPAGAPVPSLDDVLNGAPLWCRDLNRFEPSAHDWFALCALANTAPVVVDHEPGVRFEYSSGGYTIVQKLLIDVTGKPFPTLLEELVLKPFGMTHSSFLQPPRKNDAPMAATPYRATGQPVPGGPHIYPELAAAGLWTTPTDVAHFALGVVRAWTGRDASVLSQTTAIQMLTPGLGNYGLGPIVLGVAPHRRFLHAGVNDGFVSLMTMYENGDGAVIMTNGDQGGQLADEIMRSIATEYDWPDGQPKAH
ncbi:beta-lactamase family protein [Bradyrhizobium sp. Pear76]|uniref:serine hydrolase domain-containing protein n=1 Tax=Bradyrhizobium oropedii TaxID=1571201 RepID=UPI001E60A5BF|nr:serine hydrolase domain-containing protein [Bradyrhizobium oropedii]MCC8964847.1 beta-lactamase family protein [Bradyrhizobium oropedii]